MDQEAELEKENTKRLDFYSNPGGDGLFPIGWGLSSVISDWLAGKEFGN